MSETTNLGLTAMAENENQKYLRFNTAIERLAAATAARLSVSVSSGNATPTQEEVRACQLLQISGASTGGRTVTIPSVTRTLLIHSVSTNTQTVTLVRGSASIVISPGEGILVFIGSGANDLTEIISVAAGGPTITVEDESSTVSAAANTLNFRGPGVTVTEDTGGVATITITGGISVQEEGTPVVSNPTAINFVGASITVTEDPLGVAKVDVTGGGGGGSVSIEQDDAVIVSTASVINFVGSGVQVSEQTGGVATVEVSGGSGSFAGALVERQATQAVGSATATEVSFDAEIYDTDGFWDVANPTRLTVPAGVSRVRLTGCIHHVDDNVTNVGFIRKNGVDTYAGVPAGFNAESAGGIMLVTAPIAVSPGDYFELIFLPDSADTINGGSGRRTFMSIEVLTGTLTDESTRVVEVAGASHTPTLAQASSYFRCTDSGGCSVTIPTNAAVTYPVGTTLAYEQAAAGAVLIAGDTGVTVNKPASKNAATAEQYSVVQLIKVATNTWNLFGDLDPV